MGLVPELASSPADVVIFVDVDGVLNVGIWDPDGRAVELNCRNVQTAVDTCKKPGQLTHSNRRCVKRVLSTVSRQVGNGETRKYGDLVACAETGLSDLLVGRLARLLAEAGPRRLVVLSSTWRCPQHAKKVRVLEQAISAHLGERFEFDARTPLDESGRDTGNPSGRAKSISQFLETLCAQRGSGRGRPLRVLVLDDFNVALLQNISCFGRRSINTPADLERHLKAAIPPHFDAEVMVRHTVDQWHTHDGVLVRVGCGLTAQHFCSALAFLEASKELKSSALSQVPHAYSGLATSSAVVVYGGLKDTVGQTLGTLWQEGHAVCWLVQIFKHLHGCTLWAIQAARRHAGWFALGHGPEATPCSPSFCTRSLSTSVRIGFTKDWADDINGGVFKRQARPRLGLMAMSSGA